MTKVMTGCAILSLAALVGCSQAPAPKYDGLPEGAVAKAAMAYVDRAIAAADSTQAAGAAAVTLPEVAAFLAQYGLEVAPSAWDRWTWTPAPNGSSPIGWYVVRIQWAVAAGSTPHAAALLKDRVSGPYVAKVRAVDVAGQAGPWSLLGWSDNGDGGNALPRVGDD